MEDEGHRIHHLKNQDNTRTESQIAEKKLNTHIVAGIKTVKLDVRSQYQSRQ